MKKIIVISAFIFISCSISDINKSTLKYSDSAADKNILKKIHNFMIDADSFMNTNTETYETSYTTTSGKTVTCESEIVTHDGLTETDLVSSSMECSDGFKSETNYD